MAPAPCGGLRHGISAGGDTVPVRSRPDASDNFRTNPSGTGSRGQSPSGQRPASRRPGSARRILARATCGAPGKATKRWPVTASGSAGCPTVGAGDKPDGTVLVSVGQPEMRPAKSSGLRRTPGPHLVRGGCGWCFRRVILPAHLQPTPPPAARGGVLSPTPARRRSTAVVACRAPDFLPWPATG